MRICIAVFYTFLVHGISVSIVMNVTKAIAVDDSIGSVRPETERARAPWSFRRHNMSPGYGHLWRYAFVGIIRRKSVAERREGEGGDR